LLLSVVLVVLVTDAVSTVISTLSLHDALPILSVATKTGVDAIHPGYGFLAENADFAEICNEVNIKFIGPSPESIQKMGIKDIARDRKSTRLNSSHVKISYAVFCLKKKKQK